MDEFALIDAFTSAFPLLPAPFGPGDDAAVLPPQVLPGCVTTDALVEGVHFTRATFSLEDIGHKALAVNLSDLAAMGARPAWATVALGLPQGTTGAEVRRLGAGMAALAELHGVALVGGNVSRASELSLTLTVAGTLPGKPLLRSGARPGDVLVVSGPLGDAAAGLEILGTARLSGEGAIEPQGPPERHAPLDAAQLRQLVHAQRRPAPHLAWAEVARPFASAAIDVSDGLAQDLSHVLKASRVGAALEAAALPVSAALQAWAGSRAVDLALRGGEDYVVLAAVPQSAWASFSRAMLRAGLAHHRIGAVTEGVLLTMDGAQLRGRLGWQH